MHCDLCDLWSQIQIRILPKECTLKIAHSLEFFESSSKTPFLSRTVICVIFNHKSKSRSPKGTHPMPPRWHIKRYLSWMGALGYVSRINLTSAVGYVSHITSQQWGMLGPIFCVTLLHLQCTCHQRKAFYEIITRTFVLEGLVFSWLQ